MENTNEVLKKKYNIRQYIIYRMLSYDLLFFYAIDFLFLTQVKNISVSNTILLDSVYTIFRVIFQLPVTIIVDRIKTKTSLITGNIFIAISTVILIIASDYNILVISQILFAIGYTIKGICDNAFVYENIPDNREKGALFSKIDGKAIAYYDVFYAITSILAGFLFVVNGYIPVIFSLIITIIATIAAFKIKDINKDEEKNRNKIRFKSQIDDLRYGILYIFKSSRLSILILFYSIMNAFFISFMVYRKSLLSDLGVPAQYFGVIFTIIGIVSAIASNYQNKIHTKYGNKTLSFLSTTFVLSCLLIATIALLDIELKTKVVIIVLFFLIQVAAKEPFNTLGNRYLSNFTNSKIRTKIYSVRDLLLNIVRTIIGVVGSFLVGNFGTIYTIIILGILFMTISYIIIDKMKYKVGLEPDKYDKKDIEYRDIR